MEGGGTRPLDGVEDEDWIGVVGAVGRHDRIVGRYRVVTCVSGASLSFGLCTRTRKS